MDHEIDKQEASSTEGRQVKVGDKVWVLCDVATVYREWANAYIDVRHGGAVFEAKRSDCRPVEPVAKQPTRGQKLAEQALKGIWAANDAVNGTPVVKDCLTTESNCPKILDGSSDPINPVHYKHLPAEAIDIIEAAIAKAPSNKVAFLQSQVIKYMLRCWSKKGIEDLRKAKWYLDRLVGGFDDLLAEASGANDGPTRNRYRTPTLADLANGPIACEYRDNNDEHWRSGLLVYILNGSRPFLCADKEEQLSGQWDQCRIEVSE
jgi:hypothetical protein